MLDIKIWTMGGRQGGTAGRVGWNASSRPCCVDEIAGPKRNGEEVRRRGRLRSEYEMMELERCKVEQVLNRKLGREFTLGSSQRRRQLRVYSDEVLQLLLQNGDRSGPSTPADGGASCVMSQSLPALVTSLPRVTWRWSSLGTCSHKQESTTRGFGRVKKGEGAKASVIWTRACGEVCLRFLRPA